MSKEIKFVTIHSGGLQVTNVGVGVELKDGEGNVCDYQVTRITKSWWRNLITIEFSNGKINRYYGYQYVIS